MYAAVSIETSEFFSDMDLGRLKFDGEYIELLRLGRTPGEI